MGLLTYILHYIHTEIDNEKHYNEIAFIDIKNLEGKQNGK